jgi:hypothetical protein
VPDPAGALAVIARGMMSARAAGLNGIPMSGLRTEACHAALQPLRKITVELGC